MKKKIFEKGLPTLDFIFKNWPRSKYVLKKYVTSRQIRPNLFILSKFCLDELNYLGRTPLFYSLEKISKICSKNLYNNYHNEHHFKAVLIFSFLIAKNYSLKNNEKIILIIIALAHDMNHLGKRLISAPYHQEKKTIKDLERIIFRKILNHKIWKKIEKIILKTYFLDNSISKKDNLEKIILKSELICSVIFNDNVGKVFTKRLKYERQLSDSTESLFINFKKNLENKLPISDKLKFL